MNSRQTPMSKLTHHFRLFNKLISHLPIDEFRLNHTIEHDFIRIFNDKTQVVGKKESTNYSSFRFHSSRTFNLYNSFAFAFNYLKKDEPSTLFIKKIDEEFIYSKPLNIEEMKLSMNKVNKELEAGNITSPSEVFDILSSVFIGDNPQTSATMIADAAKLIETKFQESINILDENNKDISLLSNKMNQDEEKVKQLLEESEERKKVLELKEQLKLAQKNVENLSDKLEKEFLIHHNFHVIKDLKISNRKLQDKLVKLIKKEISSYPLKIKEIILDKYRGF